MSRMRDGVPSFAIQVKHPEFEKQVYDVQCFLNGCCSLNMSLGPVQSFSSNSSPDEGKGLQSFPVRVSTP